MSDGPIEFLSDQEPHTVPASEFGGADGLIQPAPHVLTNSERSAALRRAGATVDGVDPVTGLDADDLIKPPQG